MTTMHDTWTDICNGCESDGYLRHTCEMAAAERGEMRPEGGWQSRCVCCGSSFAIDPGDEAEVVNRATGAHGIAHAECYLAETDTYDLA